ncbi:MAG: ABC transporter substrate-binding protein [Oscillospiraceae bacterium]|jgi:peptide/nickel transport system substrate-binding protein|nr:ABC transporter substrate-binding protein [Oscillospiraceae bacterium]
MKNTHRLLAAALVLPLLVAAALVALLTFLVSCAPLGSAKPEQEDAVTAAPTPTGAAPTPIPSAIPEGDGRFSLRYNPSATLNPIMGTDTDNMTLSTLMYETLFTLDADFNAVGALCGSYETEDAKTYRLTLRRDAYMSDGAEVSAYDVVYSINQAKRSARYAERLKNIATVAVAGTGLVNIGLYAPDARLPALLDIPVIKDGTSGTSPRGSGPYRYVADDGVPRLVKNEFHIGVGAADAVPEIIYLVSCPDALLGEYFTERKIDLFAEDPHAPRADIRRDRETRYYNTTTLMYIGFNPRAAAIDDVRFRRAVNIAVDRDMIVREILDGRAAASPLALPPFYHLYDKTWETAARGVSRDQVADVRTLLSAGLEEIGMRDSDNDTFLEYPMEGGMAPFAIDFIVSAENAPRAAAAKTIADALRRVGLNIILRELPFAEFKQALSDGDFDMYMGETRLPANFDFSVIATPGGALNFGNMDGGAAEQNAAFMAARGDFNERNAARALCVAIAENMTFIPIAYKQYAVHSGRNEITGLSPTQTGVFYNITEWTIDPK